MHDLGDLLHRTADHAAAYRASLSERPVRAPADDESVRAAFRRELPQGPTPPEKVIEELVAAAACEIVHSAGGWVHVDGAFGLWAGANPATRHLVDGAELADSWGCDGHKWLNVPYDSGFAFCSRPAVHAAALSLSASYLIGTGGQTPNAGDFTVESSRRARGFAVWAALLELGRDGVAELVERCCHLARRFASGLSSADVEVVNDVVLNQVLVSFGDDATTDRVIEAIQRDGTCWMGGTLYRGRRLMRISVSNYSTTESDVDRSLEAILRLRS